MDHHVVAIRRGSLIGGATPMLSELVSPHTLTSAEGAVSWMPRRRVKPAGEPLEIGPQGESGQNLDRLQWIATYDATGCPAPRSHSAFAFRRANGPRNHALQKAVA